MISRIVLRGCRQLPFMHLSSFMIKEKNPRRKLKDNPSRSEFKTELGHVEVERERG